MNFEYKIDVVKPHPDIQVSPLMGDILGLQTTSIDFIYTPKSYSTAEMELEIKTTEFDSQPKRIRVTGSAAPQAGMTVTKVSPFTQSKYDPAQTGNLNVIYEEDPDAANSRLEQPKTLL